MNSPVACESARSQLRLMLSGVSDLTYRIFEDDGDKATSLVLESLQLSQTTTSRSSNCCSRQDRRANTRVSGLSRVGTTTLNLGRLMTGMHSVSAFHGHQTTRPAAPRPSSIRAWGVR